MLYQLKGLADIAAVIANERKCGGTVEAESIRLRSGEEFSNIVIISVDGDGHSIYTVGFLCEKGKHYLVHINDISMVTNPTHTWTCKIKNQFVRKQKIEEKLRYLDKLCKVNEGSCLSPFIEEVQRLINDIGFEQVRNSGITLPVKLLKEKKILQIA
ncbi:hypothetical protein AM501_24785 [Aneurinibacillus migulanus]|uniref:Uncharacterized protein n=1 Tax=Aneurinibacillus migulanus TaxID=47500 RepID=A0A0D1XSP0_ANEMI|nr:hypothetical protein [Aneurinibacillus migulanus]KIV50132.1 hypothetical protein TS65_30290 [Aneurinibacillus migulanus]KIV52665.1 hypothetical protein TS64_21925 [Aneurinibacillus migulanus]KON96162.1 hypothetical protein AF333_12380 [Aneurinibacillus migulanus]KPD05713.1 hypothetical protein AM501_24785 [Aneurinibacillus migulanus]MCP1357892.1 hypothetical protein [Aneurinibacillus migulanus]